MVDQAAPAKKPEKVVPPSPPRVIRDKQTGRSFTRIGFLGEVSDLFIRARGSERKRGGAVREARGSHSRRTLIKILIFAY